MAGKKFGYPASNLLLQPGAKITHEQDYSLKGHAAFAGDEDLLDTRPRRGDPHPKNRNLACYYTDITWTTNRLVRVEAEYIGIEQNPTPYFIEFVGSLGEESIETHPYFASLIGGTPAAPLHGAQFDPDTREFLGFPADAPNHYGGTRTYFRPSVIVRLSYWQNDPPNPGPLGHVLPPSSIDGLILPANSFNLLVTNFGYRQLSPQTPPYQITVEMLASGSVGWNDQIYPTA